MIFNNRDRKRKEKEREKMFYFLLIYAILFDSDYMYFIQINKHAWTGRLDGPERKQ